MRDMSSTAPRRGSARLTCCARLRPIGLTLAALVLAGCETLGFTSGGTGDAPVIARPRPECPSVSSPADAADLTRFSSPQSRDLTDLVVAARITALGGNCTLVQRNAAVEVILMIGMDATRGPAALGRSITVPYFVAVTDSQDRVLDKAIYSVVAEFPANTQRVRMRGEEVRLILPVTAEQPAGSYAVHVGFQLTEAELALNRSRIARR